MFGSLLPKFWQPAAGRKGFAVVPRHKADLQTLALAWCAARPEAALVFGPACNGCTWKTKEHVVDRRADSRTMTREQQHRGTGDKLYFNKGRDYGPARWPALTVNWKLDEAEAFANGGPLDQGVLVFSRNTGGALWGE